MDAETDALIQDTIRTNFSHATVLTIAHRLETIVDADRIMLLSDGKLAECKETTADDALRRQMLTRWELEQARVIESVARMAFDVSSSSIPIGFPLFLLLSLFSF